MIQYLSFTSDLIFYNKNSAPDNGLSLRYSIIIAHKSKNELKVKRKLW